MPSTADLISLDCFAKKGTTGTIFERLKKKAIQLDTSTAVAMGKMAREFGLGSNRITAEHVEDFVASQMTGWSISGAPLADRSAMGNLGAAFALSLNQGSDGLSLPKMVVAFVNGVELGVREMKRYSPRRSYVWSQRAS
jgi:hypothetical protein